MSRILKSSEMKKCRLILLFGLLSLALNAQGTFEFNIVFGIALGEVNEYATIVYGTDFNYMIKKENSMVQFGPTVGTRTYNIIDSEDELSPKSVFYIPVGGAVRFSVVDKVLAGMDLGYAATLGTYSGGLYFRPVLAYELTDGFQVKVSYESVLDVITVSNTNIGLVFSF